MHPLLSLALTALALAGSSAPALLLLRARRPRTLVG